MGTWTTSWLWGLPLICVTLAFHAFGIVLIGQMLEGRFLAVMAGRQRWGRAAMMTWTLGLVGCLLTLLHGIEALIWALAYRGIGAIGTEAGAMLYSLDSLTTRGESGLDLSPPWRLLGALEATNGVLLFGISTAFLFAVIERGWATLHAAPIDRIERG